MGYDLLTIGFIFKALEGGLGSRRRFCNENGITEHKYRLIVERLESDGVIEDGVVVSVPEEILALIPAKKKKGSKPKQVDIDYNGLKDYFNKMVENTRIPTIASISDKRRNAVNARAYTYGKEKIAEVIRIAVSSDFLSGRSGDWVATFDWLMGVKNFPKVLEGNYNGERKLGSSGATERLKDVARYIGEGD